ncbi:transcription elongation factor A N-terminal and central domain-containing protein [Alligator sinensis]|uniref:transcription Elongation factor A N-terminal and central domain-containing protein n=1 Tax=Alligator sinensis TaxID=38654 RepID=A0A1U7RZB8_ALLSI|nr:transcription elongation factor A N-terminal and central domain-containing protein [Alligator sinensis]XP_025065633.1 transcription elongation factor A N-terminal and central domain-containing protein [Alligator sinensis]
MSDRKTVIHRAHAIEKLLSENNYQDIDNHLIELEALDRTTEYLHETDVAKAVYRVLKNCPSTGLKRKAKNLLSKWKTVYTSSCFQSIQSKKSVLGNVKEDSKHFSVTVGASEELTEQNPLNPDDSKSFLLSQNLPICNEPKSHTDQQQLLEEQCSSNEDATPVVNTTSSPQDHVEVMRSKCTELLYKALTESVLSQEETNKLQKLAKEIEEHIFVLHTKNDKKYKNCIRSKVSNLRNPKSSHLKHNLFSGILNPKVFAEMTVMEMASDELKQLRASYTESSVQEHQLPQVISGTQTNKIKCRRCEKFDCTVTMIARGTLFLPSWVRNANPDEQMMTYVVCNECGEQWYHSRWVCL